MSFELARINANNALTLAKERPDEVFAYLAAAVSLLTEALDSEIKDLSDRLKVIEAAVRPRP